MATLNRSLGSDKQRCPHCYLSYVKLVNHIIRKHDEKLDDEIREVIGHFCCDSPLDLPEGIVPPQTYVCKFVWNNILEETYISAKKICRTLKFREYIRRINNGQSPDFTQETVTPFLRRIPASTMVVDERLKYVEKSDKHKRPVGRPSASQPKRSRTEARPSALSCLSNDDCLIIDNPAQTQNAQSQSSSQQQRRSRTSTTTFVHDLARDAINRQQMFDFGNQISFDNRQRRRHRRDREEMDSFNIFNNSSQRFDFEDGLSGLDDASDIVADNNNSNNYNLNVPVADAVTENNGNDISQNAHLSPPRATATANVTRASFMPAPIFKLVTGGQRKSHFPEPSKDKKSHEERQIPPPPRSSTSLTSTTANNPFAFFSTSNVPPPNQPSVPMKQPSNVPLSQPAVTNSSTSQTRTSPFQPKQPSPPVNQPLSVPVTEHPIAPPKASVAPQPAVTNQSSAAPSLSSAFQANANQHPSTSPPEQPPAIAAVPTSPLIEHINLSITTNSSTTTASSLQAPKKTPQEALSVLDQVKRLLKLPTRPMIIDDESLLDLQHVVNGDYNRYKEVAPQLSLCFPANPVAFSKCQRLITFIEGGGTPLKYFFMDPSLEMAQKIFAHGFSIFHHEILNKLGNPMVKIENEQCLGEVLQYITWWKSEMVKFTYMLCSHYMTSSNPEVPVRLFMSPVSCSPFSPTFKKISFSFAKFNHRIIRPFVLPGTDIKVKSLLLIFVGQYGNRVPGDNLQIQPNIFGRTLNEVFSPLKVYDESQNERFELTFYRNLENCIFLYEFPEEINIDADFSVRFAIDFNNFGPVADGNIMFGQIVNSVCINH